MMNIIFAQYRRASMKINRAATLIIQDLRIAHDLMMQCAATAERLLGHDRPAGSPAPHRHAQKEAARMAGLFARLGEGYGRVALLQARLPAAVLDAAVPNPAVAKPTPAAPKPKFHAAPGAIRGHLKNGNPSGDYLKSPRCGACTRAGGCCRQPAMANGRCRLHGGLSTGPRTPEGLARCRTARLVHGCRSRAHLALRSRSAHAARRLRALTPHLSARVPAGHGGHRPDSVRRRDHREGMIARCARPDRPRNPTSVSSVVNLSSPNRSTAGHGVHRSFRDHLCSSASVCGSKSRSPNGRPAAGHGVHRPDSRGVTTPAGLR